MDGPGTALRSEHRRVDERFLNRQTILADRCSGFGDGDRLGGVRGFRGLPVPAEAGH